MSTQFDVKRLIATWEARETFPTISDEEFADMLADLGVQNARGQVQAARELMRPTLTTRPVIRLR